MRRVILTDGGVYDNLGISCMLPGKSADFSTNAHRVEFIIACDVGQGMPSEMARPFGWVTRMLAAINTMHRRSQTQLYDLLHRMAANGEIAGFLLPISARLTSVFPTDLVPRDALVGYPTDFSPMFVANIELRSGPDEADSTN
jgi:NTE family protein